MLLRLPARVGTCTCQITAPPVAARSRTWGVYRPALYVHRRSQHWRSAVGEVEAEAEADSLIEAQPGADPGQTSCLTGNEPNV